MELNNYAPAQNIDAEKAVLGAMMSYESSNEVGLENLKSEDFYSKSHQIIFQAIYDIYAKNNPVDIITVSEHLKNNSLLEQAGGDEYLALLINEGLSDRTMNFYTKIVKNKSILRKLVAASRKTIEECHSTPDDVETLLDTAQQFLFEIALDKSSKDFVKIDKIMNDTYKKLFELAQNKGSVTGLETDFIDLDKKTNGLQKSDLIILAARPAVGKTSFALNLVLNIGNQNIPVGIFSLEMPKEQIALRLIAQCGKLDMAKLKAGMINKNEMNTFTELTGKLSNKPIYIDDTPGLNILDIRTKARRLKSEADIQLLIIDYLQLMSGAGKSESRQLEISNISRNLKILARDLDIPIIALSQLNRSIETRQDKTPMLSDLRESGAIEQDADIVMFLHKPEPKENDPVMSVGTSMRELIIGKHRNGEIGSVDLVFEEAFTRFKNCSMQEYS